MGFSIEAGIPAFTVFLQGIFSFFSPCVLPLLPLYIGYLSGGTGKRGEDGRMHYEQKKVIFHTICFVAGVSFAFFVLGFGFSAAGQFFGTNRVWFARIGGILVIVLGILRLGEFGFAPFGGREYRLPFSISALAMSPATAFLMGFTFSFAWTPCVGPALASVLLMAASASTRAWGFMLIGIYTLGFVLPFLAAGCFSALLLEYFKKHAGLVRLAEKAGAVVLVLTGVLMLSGKMNDVSGFLSDISLSAGQEEADRGMTGENSPEAAKGSEPGKNPSGTIQGNVEGENPSGAAEGRGPEASVTGDGSPDGVSGGNETEAGDDPNVLPAIDFTLTDQYGNSHTCSDYVGKTVFLNFWATWCPPCRAELPDIQAIYEEYQEAGDDSVVILGVAAPEFGSEKTEEEIKEFLSENGYTYPVVMDPTGELFMGYGIFSYPTTLMIDRDGNVFGYASGQLSKEMMESIIEQTITGERKTAEP